MVAQDGLGGNQFTYHHNHVVPCFQQLFTWPMSRFRFRRNHDGAERLYCTRCEDTRVRVTHDELFADLSIHYTLYETKPTLWMSE